MLLSREIWQMTGALAASFILTFLAYILPVLLLAACAVMLCLKRFARRRALLLCICAVLLVWIAAVYVSAF